MAGDTMRPKRTVLTTGEVAKICNVAPRTVSKWFDTGHLRGYRIPGSKDRRIPIDQLVQFMRAHGIPLNGLDTGRLRVLVLDADRDLTGALEAALDSDGGFDVRVADSAIEAGAITQEFKPNVLVVDVTRADIQPTVVTRFVRALHVSEPILLVGTARDLTDAAGHEFLQKGFDAYLPKPFEVRDLIRLMEDHLSAGVV